MSAIQRKKVYSPLVEGLNDKINPAFLDDREASEILNWELNERGVMEKYKGYIKDGSPFPDDPDSFIRMLLNYKRGLSVDLLLMAALDDGNTNANFKVDLKKTSGDGTYSYIGHTTGTAVISTGTETTVTGSGTTWTDHLKAGDKFKRDGDADDKYVEIASVDLDTQLTLSASYTGTLDGGSTAYNARIILHKDFIPVGVVFNNKAIISNGSETMMSYNNTTLDLITDADAPEATHLEVHKSRVFAAKDSDLYWSSVNDESAWDATSREPVHPQDNGNIISIKSFGDSLIVLKNNGRIYQVVGDFDQSEFGAVRSIRRIDAPENIGSISERTPIVHAGFLYFLTETGIYRIDQRMFVEKFTFNVDNFVSGLSFALGPTSSKSHSIDTTADWDNGTKSGVRTASGSISPIFDKYTVTDATQSDQLCAVSVGPTNSVHMVYVDQADTTKIKYKSWALDGTVTEEDIGTAPSAVLDLSMDVSPSGLVGILYLYNSSSGINSVRFRERTGAATWTVAEVPYPIDGGINANSVSVKYRSDNVARGVFLFNNPSSGGGIVEMRRSGTTWASSNAVFPLTVTISRVSLELNSSDFPRVILYEGGTTPTTIRYVAWDNDFASVTVNKTVAVTTPDTSARPQLAIDSSGVSFGVYSDNGKIVKRNFSTDVSTDLVAAEDHSLGYAILGDKNYCYYLDSSGTENFLFEDSATITNPTTATSSTSNLTGSDAFDTDGTVCVALTFGANANEIIVRRIAFSSTYTSEEFVDSSLTAWGTYAIGDQTENGATVTHEVATATTPSPSSFSTITHGQIVESDAAKIYVVAKVTFLLGSWAAPSLGSITMNYTGAGVDAKQPVGISFSNEMFYSVSRTASTENDRTLVLDIAESLIKTSYPVSAFERFKNKLYAGRSSNGDLLILKQGYNQDGSAYDSEIRSKEDFLEAIELEKDIYKFYILYEVQSSGTFDFSYRLDNFVTPGGSTWETSTVDMTQKGFAEVLVGKKGRSIQWKFENDNLDEQPSILAVVLVYGNLHIR